MYVKAKLKKLKISCQSEGLLLIIIMLLLIVIKSCFAAKEIEEI